MHLIRLLSVSLLLAFSAVAAFAFPNGLIRATSVGCTCHGGASTATSLSIPGRSGTITAKIGETLSLSLMVAHGSNSAAGMNLAVVNASDVNVGTLIAGAGSQLLSGELTHTSPQSLSGGSVSFPFQWTAPSTPGTYTLRAVGNAVNRDGSSGGDAWNSLTPITITVEPNIPTSFSISGRIVNPSGVAVSEAIVTDGTRSAITDAQGNYTITGVPNGTYTLTAARINWTFSPTTIAVTVNSANLTGQNFTGTRLWAVTGTITNPAGVAVPDVIVTVGSSTATTDAQGRYTLWLANGSYTVRAARINWMFSPATQAVSVAGADIAGQNFTGTRLWAVTGTITNPAGAAVSDVIVTVGSSTATTDAQGRYTLWLANGSYTVRVARINWTFSPATQALSVVGADIAGQNFTGTRLWAVTGSVQNPSGVGVSGITMTAGSSTATTDAQGNYTLWLANDTYTLTPSRTSWTFSPATSMFTVASADVQVPRITGMLMSSVRTLGDDAGVSVYPNPATEFAIVSYTTSSPKRIRYEVYSSLGELMRTFEESRPAGTHRFMLPLKNLASGVYYCRIRSSEGMLGTVSIIVQP